MLKLGYRYNYKLLVLLIFVDLFDNLNEKKININIFLNYLVLKSMIL